MRYLSVSALGVMAVAAALILSACGTAPHPAGPSRTEIILDSCVVAVGGSERLDRLMVIHTVDSIVVAVMPGMTEAWWVREPFMGLSVTEAGPVRQEMLIVGDSVWTVDRNGHLTPGGVEARDELVLSRMTVFYDYLTDTSLVTVGPDTLLDSLSVVPLTLTGETEVVFYYSRETWLPVLMTAKTMGLQILSTPDDYMEVQGITTASTTVSVIEMLGQEIASRNILTEFDVPVPDSLFVLTAGAADWELTESGREYPFSLDQEHIFMQGEVNGVPVTILLDSGAGATVMDSSLAAELGLETTGSLPARGVAGTEEFSFARVGEYSAAGATVRGQNLAVMPLADIFYPATGHHIDLILGYDFLSRFVAKIDYGSETISLFDPAEFSVDLFEGDILEATRSMSLLSINAVLEDSIPVTLLLDTGAGGCIHLTGSFFEKHPDFLDGRPTFGTMVQGVGGVEDIEGFRVGSITLGDFRVPGGLCSSFEGTEVFDAYDGIVGTGILSRFVLYLDYSRDQVLLEPSSLFTEGLPENLTGLGLEIAGDHLLVGTVVIGSAADAAGILEGDTLVAVDGVEVGPEDLPGMRKMMPSTPGMEIVVTVVRKGDRHDLPLTATPLVP